MVEQVIREQDKLLLSVIFSDTPSQKDVDNLLSVWDIEAEGAESGLLLAQFKESHPELSFPQYVGPRLDGLIRYFRFKNATVMAGVKDQLASLIELGIPFVAQDDFAMKLFFDGTPRPMDKIDIGVPAEFYSEVKGLSGENLSIHKIPYPLPRSEGTIISHKIPGISIPVPGIGQMFCQSLARLASSIEEADDGILRPVLISDIISLLRMNPSADDVRQYAMEGRIGAEMKYGCILFRKLLPSVKLDDYEAGCCSEEQWKTFTGRLRYIDKTLRPARTLRHKYTISFLMKHPTSVVKWVCVYARFTVANSFFKIKYKPA